MILKPSSDDESFSEELSSDESSSENDFDEVSSPLLSVKIISYPVDLVFHNYYCIIFSHLLSCPAMMNQPVMMSLDIQ